MPAGRCVTMARMTSPKPYQQLATMGRARRLRRLALNALRQYDLDVTHLRLITNSFNGIFRVDTTSGDKYVLRVTLPEGGHNPDTVQAETLWLEALANNTDLSLPRPIAAGGGRLVVEAGCDGVPEPRLCILFSWVPGTNLSNHLNPGNLSKLGRLMAQLHSHAATFQLEPVIGIPRYDRVFPFSEPIVLFDKEYRHLFPPKRRKLFEQAIEWAQEAIDRLKASQQPMQVLHGDLHQWNVRLFHGVLSPIDFEDLMWGWPVQDVGTTLFYFLDDPEYIAFREAFREGYTNHSQWPETVPGDVDAFIAARAAMLVNFVIQDPNPDWRARAVEFVEKNEARLQRLIEKRI
jgi:Ser/Thr protein kinase RdoA (MazF antagonist)